MVYDSARSKFILFGGRAGSGYNLEDTWEWDPGNGTWSDVGSASHPSARSQSAMVFEKSSGQVLLFGGGRSNSVALEGSDDARDRMFVLEGDGLASREIWELDPRVPAFTNRTAPLDVPDYREAFAMAFNPVTGRTCLFGGERRGTRHYFNDLWESGTGPRGRRSTRPGRRHHAARSPWRSTR